MWIRIWSGSDKGPIWPADLPVRFYRRGHKVHMRLRDIVVGDMGITSDDEEDDSIGILTLITKIEVFQKR